jgi:hypothetical protein
MCTDCARKNIFRFFQPVRGWYNDSRAVSAFLPTAPRPRQCEKSLTFALQSRRAAAFPAPLAARQTTIARRRLLKSRRIAVSFKALGLNFSGEIIRRAA